LLPVSVGLPGLKELTVLPEGPLGEELARTHPELPTRTHPERPIGPTRESGDSQPDEGASLVADLCGRLYPLLLAGYARRLESSSPAADGAVVRTLGRLAADLESVRSEALALIEAGRPGGAAKAGERLEPRRSKGRDPGR